MDVLGREMRLLAETFVVYERKEKLVGRSAGLNPTTIFQVVCA
jgi:hypothetical protein